jgi:Flp pilus assembly protein TadD
VHALASLAHLLAEQGQHMAAAEHLQQLLTWRPDDASAWFNLGYVLEQTRRLDDAEQAFRRATQLAPSLDRAWYGLALSLIGQQRLDEAVPALRQATTLQPMSPHGWYQLARVHAQRQELEQAEHIIEHLRGFEPRVAAQLVRETGLGAAPAPT